MGSLDSGIAVLLCFVFYVMLCFVYASLRSIFTAELFCPFSLDGGRTVTWSLLTRSAAQEHSVGISDSQILPK